MAFKDLIFINKEKGSEKSKEESKKTTSKTKFPAENFQETEKPVVNKSDNSGLFGSFSFGKSAPSANQVSDEHLSKALELYQNGFDSLNQPGYDFYEFYQTVTNGGAQNAQVYPMAFAMGSAMEKTISKEKLVQQADFYVAEIIKQYNDFVAKGNSKKDELINQKSSENQSLLSELDMLKQQQEAIAIQIKDRETKLSAIGSKYEPKIGEIDSKLAANDLAKNKVVQSIEQVKQGIINNIK